MIGTIVYLLCALTSLACAALLLRGYRASGARLLLWSSICFFGFFANNVLLLADTKLVPETDLSVLRSVPVIIGLVGLLWGLIWDSES